MILSFMFNILYVSLIFITNYAVIKHKALNYFVIHIYFKLSKVKKSKQVSIAGTTFYLLFFNIGFMKSLKLLKQK